MLSASCYPIFENKKWKEGKSPKRKIKGLEKKKIKKNIKNGAQTKKEIKLRHESDASQNASTFYFCCKINDYV